MLDNNKNGISVIIPVYNRESFLGNCIDSVLSQDYQGQLEVIISDDGSTDKSLEIAESYGNKVRIVYKPEGCTDQGASATRNRGILVAKNNYICFLDSDDYFLPKHLTRMSDELDKNGKLGYVFCRSKQEITSKKGEKKIIDWTRRRLSHLDKAYHVISRRNCIHTNTIMFRRSVFSKVGMFNTALKNGEDGDMWMRVAEKFQGKFVDSYGSVYRVNHGEGQLVEANAEQVKKDADILYTEAFSRNYIDNKDPLRLLLHTRILLLEKRIFKYGKIGTLYNHVIVTAKLFFLFPSTTIKFLLMSIK